MPPNDYHIQQINLLLLFINMFRFMFMNIIWGCRWEIDKANNGRQTETAWHYSRIVAEFRIPVLFFESFNQIFCANFYDLLIRSKLFTRNICWHESKIVLLTTEMVNWWAHRRCLSAFNHLQTTVYTNTRNNSLRIFSTNGRALCQCRSEQIDLYHSLSEFKPFEFEYDGPASIKFCTICVSVKSFSNKLASIILLRKFCLFLHIRMSMKSIVHTSCYYHVIALNEFGL